MDAQMIQYPAADGLQIDAYLAIPSGRKPCPGIVLIQEIFGLTDHMKDLARRFAGEGYAALVPDLYTRDGRREVLTQQRAQLAMRTLGQHPELRNAPERAAELIHDAEALSAVQAYLAVRAPAILAALTGDLVSAVEWLYAHPAIGKSPVGAIGWCFGGALSGRLACAAPEQLAAAVILYGQAPPSDQVPAIRCPLLGHFAGADETVNATLPDFASALAQHQRSFAFHYYPGAKHAFMNDQGANHHPEAAAEAWQRTLGFFADHL